jgi:hypothetical protein
MSQSAAQILDSIDWPSLDLQRGPIYVDIGFLADADHRTAFRMIFERLLDVNREMLDPMAIIAVEADRPLRPQGSALSDLPAAMSVIMADAAKVADVLYDSLNEHVDVMLVNASKATRLRIAFDNPEFSLA